MSCIDLICTHSICLLFRSKPSKQQIHTNSVVDPHDHMTCVLLGGGFCKFHVYSGFKLSTYSATLLKLTQKNIQSQSHIKTMMVVQEKVLGDTRLKLTQRYATRYDKKDPS